MKTTIITILASTLLIVVGFNSTAKNSGQEPPLKKQTPLQNETELCIQNVFLVSAHT